jgi:hypothetical protein
MNRLVIGLSSSLRPVAVTPRTANSWESLRTFIDHRKNRMEVGGLLG